MADLTGKSPPGFRTTASSALDRVVELGIKSSNYRTIYRVSQVMIYSISDLVPSCGAISDHLNARLAAVGGRGSWPAGLPPCRATIDDAAPAAVGSSLH